MKASLVLALALAHSVLAGAVCHPGITRQDKLKHAGFNVCNKLSALIANVEVKHISKPQCPVTDSWDSLESNKTSDARPVSFALLQTRFDFWAVSWETPDGKMGCSLPVIGGVNPPNYKMHNLARADVGTTKTLNIKPGYNGPFLYIKSVSGWSQENFRCRWLNSTESVGLDDRRYSLVKPRNKSWVPGIIHVG